MYYGSIRALRSMVYTELHIQKNTIKQLPSWKSLQFFLLSKPNVFPCFARSQRAIFASSIQTRLTVYGRLFYTNMFQNI